MLSGNKPLYYGYVNQILWRHRTSNSSNVLSGTYRAIELNTVFYYDMGQVTELRLSCYLVLLSIDSKTR